jgi:hypothetical protein
MIETMASPKVNGRMQMGKSSRAPQTATFRQPVEFTADIADFLAGVSVRRIPYAG